MNYKSRDHDITSSLCSFLEMHSGKRRSNPESALWQILKELFITKACPIFLKIVKIELTNHVGIEMT